MSEFTDVVQKQLGSSAQIAADWAAARITFRTNVELFSRAGTCPSRDDRYVLFSNFFFAETDIKDCARYYKLLGLRQLDFYFIAQGLLSDYYRLKLGWPTRPLLNLINELAEGLRLPAIQPTDTIVVQQLLNVLRNAGVDSGDDVARQIMLNDILRDYDWGVLEFVSRAAPLQEKFARESSACHAIRLSNDPCFAVLYINELVQRNVTFEEMLDELVGLRLYKSNWVGLRVLLGMMNDAGVDIAQEVSAVDEATVESFITYLQRVRIINPELIHSRDIRAACKRLFDSEKGNYFCRFFAERGLSLLDYVTETVIPPDTDCS